MAYLTGITLELKEDVTAKLARMIPQVERLQRTFQRMDVNLSTAEGLKKTNAQLDMMNQKMKNVAVSAKELKSVGQGIGGIGNHAAAASRKVGFLESKLKAVGHLVSTFAFFGAIGAIGAGVKQGADFSQKVSSLGLQGFSGKEQDTIRQKAIDIGRSSLLTPEEAVDYARFTKPIMSTKDAISTMGDAANFTTAMRKLNAKNVHPEDSAKIAELFLKRTPAGIRQIQDAIVNIERQSGGQIDLGALRMQVGREGPARFGADPQKNLANLAYVQLETAGSKGGGGGSGGAGTSFSALQQTLVGGRMTLALANELGKMGLLEGLDEAKAKEQAKKMAKHHAGHSRTLTKWHQPINMGADGQMHIGHGYGETITLSKGGSTKGGIPEVHLSMASMKEYGVKLKDAALVQTQGVGAYLEQKFIPALERQHHMKSGDFFKEGGGGMTDVQKMMLLQPIAGAMRVTAARVFEDFALAHSRKAYFDKGVASGGGVAQTLNANETGMAHVSLERFTASWHAFNDAIFGDKRFIAFLQILLNDLTDFINVAGPAIMKFSNSKAGATIGSWLQHAQQIFESFGNVIQRFINSGFMKTVGDQFVNLNAALSALAGNAIFNTLTGGKFAAENQAPTTFDIKLPGHHGTMGSVIGGQIVPPPPMEYIGPGAAKSIAQAYAAQAVAPTAVQRGKWVGDEHGLHLVYNQNAPILGTAPTAFHKEIAKAVKPHLDKMDFQQKQQFQGASSSGAGSHVPQGIGGGPSQQ